MLKDWILVVLALATLAFMAWVQWSQRKEIQLSRPSIDVHIRRPPERKGKRRPLTRTHPNRSRQYFM